MQESNQLLMYYAQSSRLPKQTHTDSINKELYFNATKMNVKKEDRAVIEFILDILIISSGIISLDTYLMASSINAILGHIKYHLIH